MLATPTSVLLFLPVQTLKSVVSLPPWAHGAFTGYRSLNRIQSRLCDIALSSDENLLLCAPTVRECVCVHVCTCVGVSMCVCMCVGVSACVGCQRVGDVGVSMYVKCCPRIVGHYLRV